jgi:uncharacterized protein involved in exopolysaccharide biosynthesis
MAQIQTEHSARGITFFSLLELLITHARILVASSVIAGLAVGVASLLSPRQYVATASFIPESGGETSAGLAAAARQFGIGMGGASASGWPAGLYVQVLSSQAMMVSLAGDSVSVAETDGRTVALVDLFEIAEGSPEVRVEKLVKLLRREVVSVSESRLVGSVSIRVQSRWTNVSEALAIKLMKRVDEFNQRARLETAEAELSFIDGRVDSARIALGLSESRLASFLTRNRAANEPQLQFQRDQLEREVRFHEQLLLGLAQQREEARLRRARDVPSFTVVEYPRAPSVGEPRGTIARTILGAVAAFVTMFGLLLLRQSLALAAVDDPEATLRLRYALHRTMGKS